MEKFNPAPIAHSPSIASLLSVISRIEVILVDEVEALKDQMANSIKVVNERKSRALLDFNRALRTLTPDGHNGVVVQRITELRRKLEAHKTLLGLHLSSVRDISKIISKAFLDAESDGTYTGQSAIRNARG